MTSILEKNDLTKIIASTFNFRDCILLGRATSCFYSIFSSFFQKGDNVIFPAILCPQPLLAAKLAGLNPIVIDVNQNNGLINLSELETLLSKNINVRCVVLVELFGQKIDNWSEILNLKKKFKFKIIRDCAQSLPLKKIRCDFTILSFGHTKIIDCDHGGAILIDNKNYKEILRRNSDNLNPFNKNKYKFFIKNYRKQFYKIKNKPRLNHNEKVIELYELLTKNDYFYKTKFSEEFSSCISKKIKDIKNIVLERRRLFVLYKKNLNHKDVLYVTNNEDYIPWRFSVLLPPNMQKFITNKLRSNGFHASNWYDPLSIFFDKNHIKYNNDIINSHHFSSRILNLWIDENINDEYIESSCTLIKEYLNKY